MRLVTNVKHGGGVFWIGAVLNSCAIASPTEHVVTISEKICTFHVVI